MNINEINELAINLIRDQVVEEWWNDSIDDRMRTNELITALSRINGVISLRNEIEKFLVGNEPIRGEYDESK